MLRLMDFINEKVGAITCYVVIFMAVIGVAEVLLRYLFNSPTSWAWPVNGQLLCIFIALGGGYTYLHNGHVRMDVIYDRLPSKIRAIVDVATFPTILFFLAIMLWQTIDNGWMSFLQKEHSLEGFYPPIWHLKLIVIPLGAFLVLIQTIAAFVRSLRLIRGRSRNES